MCDLLSNVMVSYAGPIPIHWLSDCGRYALFPNDAVRLPNEDKYFGLYKKPDANWVEHDVRRYIHDGKACEF